MGGVRSPVPNRETYLARWAQLHGGYDPASGLWLVRAWLVLIHRLASPFAALRVPPSAITAAGVALTALAVPAAAAGGRWPLLGVAALALGGLADSVDGAVAVLTDRVSAWGYVLDSVADRCGDALCLLALWCLGASAGLVVSAGVALGLLEYTRARAGCAGFAEIGVVTVGERPTRLIVAGFGLAGAGVVPGWAGGVVSATAAATLAVAAIGLGQLMVTVRAALAGSDRSAD
ncbi:CDP-alcohol phosphatidyltransferase family protein [Frankia sp. AgB32]|uniref:CDP-alcohol phosphatidyltransferase family protein n=1 Tax=Frankia sp. AgB32 TaxID=631119 RepID=UPI00200D251A|nr:CDP-alcohol phosphatidyltransferase family protein [Frankia sp. AgB32]